MIINSKTRKKTFWKSLEKMIFLVLLFFSLTTVTFAQELDIEGNGGNTFAIRGSGTTTWQSFYPSTTGSYKAFLQSWPSGDFDVAAFGGDLKFYSGSAYNMRLLANGRLGLGTTTPSAQLHLAGTNSEKLRLEGNSTWISWYNGATYKGYLYHNGNDMTLSNQLAGNLYFRTNSSTRLSINSVGDVGIGTTVPSSKMEIVHNSTTFDAQLELYENASDYARLKFRSNPTGTVDDDKFWDIAGRTGTSSQTFFNLYYYNGSSGNNFFSIDPNNNNIRIDGDVVPLDPSMQFDLGNNPSESWDDVVGDDFINTSDKRLKQNIRPVKDVLPRLMSMNPVNYEYIDSHNPDKRNRTGFLAQEVQDIFPAVVIDEYVDIDPNTGAVVRTKSEFLAMNYIELIPITIKGMQEQQETIDELKAMVEALVQRIEELEK